MIVYTIGCFDLLHIGHIRFLKQSKELGKILIVGIHDDKTIFSYKNRYPIIPFEQRIEMVESIKWVDRVVKTDGISDINFVKKYNVNIVTVVPTWFNYKHNLNRRERIEELGAKVVIVPYTEWVSTTQIIQSIRG